MDRTTTILIVLIVILVGALALVGGFILQANTFNNTSNTSQPNQTNVSVGNGSTDNILNDSDRNETNTTTDPESTDEQHNNGVAYRISSNTPDCPECGSNNIEQLGDTLVDEDTNEWVVQAKCRYCGYEWEHRVSRASYY